MANLITHSLTYTKEDIDSLFFKPLFIDSDVLGDIEIRMGVKTGEKLNFVGKLEKITKAWAQGSSFTSSTGVTITQKTVTVSKLKAEVQQNGHAFYNTIFQELLASGVDANDINSAPKLREIVATIVVRGMAADLQRQIWFGNTNKETVSSDIATGTADTDYNVYSGLWKLIFDGIASTDIPSAQVLDINSTTYLNTAAVKQVATCTLTGTSGTANITVNGVAYLATFTTDLTTSAANFVTSHGATIAARFGGAVVTSSGAGVIFTANIAGVPISVSNAVNVSGNLAGTTAATTANVAYGTLKTDAAKAIFKSLYAKMPNEFAAERADARFYVTRSVYENYMETIETASGIPAAYSAMIDGVQVLAFRGIPVVEKSDWDTRIAADFGGQYPHRVLLAMPKNLLALVDSENAMTSLDEFYDKKEQVNYIRAEFLMGASYVHPNFIVVAR